MFAVNFWRNWIEIQKSRKPTDLIRFRTYLGEQYQQTDMVEVKSGKVEKALPIAKKDDTIDKLEDENAKLRSQLAKLQAIVE